MQKEIDLKEILSIFLKKWYLILISMLVFGTVFFVYTKVMIEEQFTSYGSLYVNNKAQDVIQSFEQNNTANLYDLTTAEMLVETYKTILNSNNFYNMIIRSENLEYKAKELSNMISYESVEETGIIQVYVTAASPEEANKLCSLVLEYANYGIMEIVEVGSVKTVDDATLPVSRAYPSATKHTAIGMILGAMFACGLIFLRSILDNKIKTVEDLEMKLGFVVLGVIPKIDE